MMAEILFADDDAAMRQMVADTLRTASHQVRLARNGREALDELRRSAPDLVLLDYRMGTPDGLEVCRAIKADPRFGHLPVLILTGEGKLESRLMGFDAGADDYLPKPFDTRELLARIGALLRLARRGLDRNPTSQLPGGEAILVEYERRQWTGREFAVCYLDLDDFKAFNDRFGFSVADAVIRETGDMLRHISDGTEAFVGHVGGDDFIMLCEPGSARRLAEQARSTLRERLERHLPDEIARTGRYSAVDRNNVVREYPVTCLAAAIMYIPAGSSVSLAKVGEAVAAVKQRAKQPGGTGIAEAEFPA